MFVANKVFAANEINCIENDDELVEKYRKLLKIGKLSKSQKLAISEKKC